MSIPNYVATPHQPHDEFISCNGTGETIADALNDLAGKQWDLHAFAENEGLRSASEIVITVYKGISPEDAGWDDNEHDFAWCISDKPIHQMHMPLDFDQFIKES